MKLKEKTIVLTGGTSGIGLEILKNLYQENTVIVIARHMDKLTEQNLILNQIVSYTCDLSNLKQLDEVATKILERYPKIDVLINNAAIQYTPKFLDSDFSIESIEHEITVNLTSVCRLTYLLLPSLLKDSRSLILNVNSGLALAPKKTSAIYCATKSALNSLSLSLQYQLEETNIRVLQGFMPLVDTPMTKGRGSKKISAAKAAQKLINGLKEEKSIIDVGKVRLLRLLLHFYPRLAYKIMKRE